LATALDKLDASSGGPRQKCRVWNCQVPEIKSKGLFRGIGYCPKHHFQKFSAIVTSPDLENILSHKFLAVEFVEYIQKKWLVLDDEENVISDASGSTTSVLIQQSTPYLQHYYHFLDACKQYDALGAKNLKEARSHQVFSRYLDRRTAYRYVQLPKSLLDEMNVEMKEHPGSKTLFHNASKYSMEVLNKSFEGFLGSAFYDRALTAITMPDEAVEEVMVEYRLTLAGRGFSTMAFPR
jgi:hypothetical protein